MSRFTLAAFHFRILCVVTAGAVAAAWNCCYVFRQTTEEVHVDSATAEMAK